MQIWNNCKMLSLSYDCSRDESSCEVKIDGKNIVVSYIEEGHPTAVIYKGTEHDPGHYELSNSNNDVRGRATLHRFKGSNFLEGWWEEKGMQGMWRITLNK